MRRGRQADFAVESGDQDRAAAGLRHAVLLGVQDRDFDRVAEIPHNVGAGFPYGQDGRHLFKGDQPRPVAPDVREGC